MLTLTFDNGASTAISDTGILECALAFCKARNLGGTITNAAGEIVGYVRRTASANSGWSAYLTEQGQS
jgi:hypothetical protein